MVMYTTLVFFCELISNIHLKILSKSFLSSVSIASKIDKFPYSVIYAYYYGNVFYISICISNTLKLRLLTFRDSDSE